MMSVETETSSDKTFVRHSPDMLAQAWEEKLAADPRLRIRNAAAELGCSEAELLATRVGDTVTRLRGPHADIIRSLPSLGRVMALTRNDAVVHERKGAYTNVEVGGPMGIVLGPEIDLRLFMTHWSFAFAVTEVTTRGPDRRSIQFFTGDGEALHKVYATKETEIAAYDALVDTFRAEEQPREQPFYPRSAPVSTAADADVDVPKFQQEWRDLEDTHHFFGLMRRHKLAREQSLRLAPAGFAEPVAQRAYRTILEDAAASATPIMCFVGSRGCIQIHTGTVHRLLDASGWYNVLDPDFNLHIREESVARCWVVRKPTVDGDVTSLEVFDASGELIMQFFGERKPGSPELPAWRELVARLERV